MIMRAFGTTQFRVCGALLLVGSLADANGAVAGESKAAPPSNDAAPPDEGLARILREHEGWTPRESPVLPYLGFAVGFVSVRSSAGDRAAVGSGLAGTITLGVALWDQIPINVAVGGLLLEDRNPFSEFVVTCESVGNTLVDCGDPHNQGSHVTGTVLNLETGYQHRFRPSSDTSLVPGALVGYEFNPGGFSRGVDCKGCKSIDIPDFTGAGPYVAPFLRMTIGPSGEFALSVRSPVFLAGDLAYSLLLGFELGAP